ncbi:MAG: transketolase family protein [Candidatus Altiarchaeota archaeon]
MRYDLDRKEHTRSAYGKTLVKLGKENKEIVVLDSDLSESTKTVLFAREFPERFFNVGCAEQNLMGMSAGFALEGKTVFTSGFAMFGCGRGWEQIRNSIAYDALNVKIVLTHAGITVGKDGSSHQILEDICLMRSIPNMRVTVPADAREVEVLITAAAGRKGPEYFRLTREKTPVLSEEYGHDANKPVTLIDGSDATIFACGVMISESIKAAYQLEGEGVSVRVVNMHTIKPLHEKTVLKAAKETGFLVTAEEHSIIGGLGSAVSEVLCEKRPTPMRRVGVRDVFGQSGDAWDLMAHYGLMSKDIVAAVKDVMGKS